MKNPMLSFPLIHRLAVFFVLLAALTSSSVSYAHRGAADEVDACNILVGHERVHFTAYTPEHSHNKGYCEAIPTVEETNLVFDYEGKSLRNLTVEFEVTKEPEGTRVFYKEPTKIKSGTVTGDVDFRDYGAGEYLAHVTIVDEGERLDSHIPFSVGVEDGHKSKFPTKTLLVLGITAVIVYVLKRAARNPLTTA